MRNSELRSHSFNLLPYSYYSLEGPLSNQDLLHQDNSPCDHSPALIFKQIKNTISTKLQKIQYYVLKPQHFKKGDFLANFWINITKI